MILPTNVRLVCAALAALGLAACATPEGGPTPGAPASGTTAKAPASPGAGTAATPSPEVSAAEAKPAAQKLALQAVDQLQVGDETGARLTIEQALKLDATNELAKNLLGQINADAQRELGATFFRYTVQQGDSLSRLAQQFLGDRFRFWVLAKYNEMANPSRLAAGQVVKIPGRAPPTLPVAATPEPAPAPARPATPEPEPKPELADAMKKGADQEKAGNLEAAYATYVDAATRYPASTEASRKRDATKGALIRTLDREASQAFQRQNLDLAISKWDRILELDSNNRKARLERERALDLRKRMAEKFGDKPAPK
jgi:LysM repeat protein